VNLPGAQEGGVLVSTEWLAARLDDAGLDAGRLRVIDIRGKVMAPGTKPRYLPKRAEYDEAHIPGALFVDWTRDIVDTGDPVPVQVARPEAFAAKMRELGIADDTLVVAYDDYDHIFAGRLAWALRYYGHDEVRILDGGWSRWVAEGRETTRGKAPTTPSPAATSSTFTARVRPELRATADDVANALARTGVLILDARAPDQYEGTVSAAGRGGHIPGAHNVPYARLVDQNTGRFLPQTQLALRFEEAGVDVGRLPPEIIVYCNGGISCTVALNALRMFGRDDVAVYDGSWNEWGSDASRPIKAGRKP
jgi:thiosulfate/3-mercaptopyruvate sulfurtransferase